MLEVREMVFRVYLRTEVAGDKYTIVDSMRSWSFERTDMRLERLAT